MRTQGKQVDDAELQRLYETGVEWVRFARSERGDPSEEECEWFGNLAAKARRVRALLEQIGKDGRLISVSADEAEVFLRFELFSEVLWLLHKEKYAWVNVLDDYGHPWWWNKPAQVTRARTSLPSPTSLGEASAFLREGIDKLQRALAEKASPGEMGRILREVFVGACCILVAIELELERFEREE